MDECLVDSRLLERTACILSYAGSTHDICINYVTLGLTLIVATCRAWDTASAIPESKLQVRWIVATVAALVGVCLFQIGLCWVLGCAGISIIWCAVAGWIISERQHHEEPGDAGQPAVERSPLDMAEDVTLTVILGVLIYYAVKSPLITTVAHACALILGTLLSRINRRLVLAKSQMYETVAADES